MTIKILMQIMAIKITVKITLIMVTMCVGHLMSLSVMSINLLRIIFWIESSLLIIISQPMASLSIVKIEEFIDPVSVST